MTAVLAAAVFLLQAPSIHGQADALSLAAKTEKADPSAALKLYKSAFEKASSPDAVFKAFEGILRLERDFATIVRLSQDLAVRVKDTPYPAGLALRLGRFLELSGRMGDALAIYERPVTRDASTEATSAALALCLEMNDLEAAARIMTSVKLSAEAEGQTALQRGDTRAARAAFEAALSESGGKSIRAMYGLYSVAIAEGDPEKITKAADALIAAYPRSPEAAIVKARGPGAEKARIVLAPVPTQTLGSEPPAATPEPAADAQARHETASEQPAAAPVFNAKSPAPEPDSGTSQEPAAKASVQAGSYRVRENADDMARELEKRGFHPVVREASVGGVTYYKAFACDAVDLEEARKVLARLRESGFEGILVLEKP